MIDNLWEEFGETPIGSGTIYPNTVSIKDIKKLIVPEYKWTWKFSKNNCTKFYSPDAPCWAHRLMQRVVLGIIWEKL